MLQVDQLVIENAHPNPLPSVKEAMKTFLFLFGSGVGFVFQLASIVAIFVGIVSFYLQINGVSSGMEHLIVGVVFLILGQGVERFAALLKDPAQESPVSRDYLTTIIFYLLTTVCLVFCILMLIGEMLVERPF
ncbi:MAG: hypothetical protein ACFCBW_07305 [Candidatus Competibacterales bacterium]